jgi:NAD(P)-dependent dehydrogenase (short-subunit alcohol dehydrogenase family)
MTPTKKFSELNWALILGGSSGFGLATAKKLASEGMSLCLVHRDRKGAMDRIEKEFAEIRAFGNGLLTLNLDALSAEGVTATIGLLREKMGAGKVRTLLHSVAYGNLKPIAPVPGMAEAALIEEEDMARTIHSMGTSLLTWTQRLHKEGMFASDARVIGLTSEGNEIAWRGYAAVSAAKCALESVSRSIAVEFAPYGIRSNIVQAGITDTPALRLIPGSEQMKANAIARNPLRRLTTTEDVANAIFLLSTDEASWINGALLRVDGGEHIGSA